MVLSKKNNEIKKKLGNTVLTNAKTGGLGMGEQWNA